MYQDTERLGCDHCNPSHQSRCPTFAIYRGTLNNGLTVKFVCYGGIEEARKRYSDLTDVTPLTLPHHPCEEYQFITGGALREL